MMKKLIDNVLQFDNENEFFNYIVKTHIENNAICENNVEMIKSYIKLYEKIKIYNIQYILLYDDVVLIYEHNHNVIEFTYNECENEFYVIDNYFYEMQSYNDFLHENCLI